MSLEDNYCGYLQTEASVSILGSILRQKDKETLFHCVLSPWIQIRWFAKIFSKSMDCLFIIIFSTSRILKF